MLKHRDRLAKALQSPKLSVSDGRTMGKKTIVILKNLHKDLEYDLFKRKVNEIQEELGMYTLLPIKS